MKLFKRIWMSIQRRKAVSLTLFFITFILGNVLAVSICISQSKSVVYDNLMNNIGGKMSIITNVSSRNSVQYIQTDEEYEIFMNKWYAIHSYLSQTSYVKYSDYNLHIGNVELKNNNYEIDNMEEMTDLLHGIQNADLIDEKENRIALIDGQYISKEQIESGKNVILVSSDVKINGEQVKVGDKIEFVVRLEMFNNEYITTYSDPISFEVIGIFQPIREKYSEIHDIIYPFYVSNQSIVNLQNIYNQMKKECPYRVVGKHRIWVNSSIIHAKSPDNLESLINAAVLLTTEYDFNFETTKSIATSLMSPINTFANIANIATLFTSITLTIIVGLISLYFIKNRQKEIGIYISLGIKKYELILQIMMEIILVGMLGILLSMGSGKIVSENYSNKLLNMSITIRNEEYEKYTTGIPSIDSSSLDVDDVINNYEIYFSVQDAFKLGAIGFITLVISSVPPLLYIINLKPKNILLD